MEYTLDELVGAVTGRLQATGLEHQTNGQVSAFPDRRTLRYYTTIGLMDRPDTVRDRQAIYGDRHVAQAVAVKRLQASGLALAAIQHRLAGLPQAQVEAIAAGRAERAGEVSGVGSRRFWAEASSAVLPAAPSSPAPSAGPRPRSNMSTTGTAAGVLSGARPDSRPDFGPRPMLAIALSSDATLLLATDRPLTPDDISDIRAAACGLLEHIDQLSAAESTGVERDRKDHR